MSFSQEVLAELSSYLEKTLSPDPAVRRPGIFTFWPLKPSYCLTIILNALPLFIS